VTQLKSELAALESAKSRVDNEVSGAKVSEAVVRRYVEDLRALLKDGDAQLRKTVLRSFIERIEVSGDTVTVEYHLR
jgi:hypothetical protein